MCDPVVLNHDAWADLGESTWYAWMLHKIRAPIDQNALDLLQSVGLSTTVDADVIEALDLHVIRRGLPLLNTGHRRYQQFRAEREALKAKIAAHRRVAA